MLSLVMALSVVLAACSTGSDAVVSGTQFSFVSPGGKTELYYDPPKARGTVPDFSGESLMEPGQQIALSDFAGRSSC